MVTPLSAYDRQGALKTCIVWMRFLLKLVSFQMEDCEIRCSSSVFDTVSTRRLSSGMPELRRGNRPVNLKATHEPTVP